MRKSSQSTTHEHGLGQLERLGVDAFDRAGRVLRRAGRRVPARTRLAAPRARADLARAIPPNREGRRLPGRGPRSGRGSPRPVVYLEVERRPRRRQGSRRSRARGRVGAASRVSPALSRPAGAARAGAYRAGAASASLITPPVVPATPRGRGRTGSDPWSIDHEEVFRQLDKAIRLLARAGVGPRPSPANAGTKTGTRAWARAGTRVHCASRESLSFQRERAHTCPRVPARPSLVVLS
jgi:hypothetical protein